MPFHQFFNNHFSIAFSGIQGLLFHYPAVFRYDVEIVSRNRCFYGYINFPCVPALRLLQSILPGSLFCLPCGSHRIAHKVGKNTTDADGIHLQRFRYTELILQGDTVFLADFLIFRHNRIDNRIAAIHFFSCGGHIFGKGVQHGIYLGVFSPFHEFFDNVQVFIHVMTDLGEVFPSVFDLPVMVPLRFPCLGQFINLFGHSLHFLLAHQSIQKQDIRCDA